MTQLTIEKIYPMAEGAKSGGLKATNGNTYKFLPWQLKFIKEGAELDVPITESPYNGKTYLWFSKDWPTKDAQNAARTAPAPQPAPAAAAPSPTPSANGNKDVLIVAQVLYKGLMSNGQFGVTDLPGIRAAVIAEARAIVDACK